MIRTFLMFPLLLCPVLAIDEQKPEPNKHVAQSFSYKNAAGQDAKLNYWLYLPPSADKPAAPLPLLLFLHGSGERGTDLALVLKHGPPALVGKSKDLDSFVVVSPQCPLGGWWDIKAVKGLCDEVALHHKADINRIYLTGLSMGGYATWKLLADYPDYWAAAVPICGGGTPDDAKKFKHVPIWAFHGAKDATVKITLSDSMIAALKEAGAAPKYTIYPEAAHDSWTESYANPELYKWLLEQKRQPPSAKKAETP